MWHGSKDVTLSTQNFFEGVKQWTNVFGYSQTPTSNVSMSGFPAGYSLSTYGPKFQAILAQGVGHELPVRETNALAFMGL
jgi:acetylxylan esterase